MDASRMAEAGGTAEAVPGASAGWRFSLRSLSLRIRLLVLVLIAGLPVVALALDNMLAADRRAAAAPQRLAGLVLHAAQAQQDAAVGATVQLLNALAFSWDARQMVGPTCATNLRALMLAADGRYADLWASGAGGTQVCSAIGSAHTLADPPLQPGRRVHMRAIELHHEAMLEISLPVSGWIASNRDTAPPAPVVSDSAAATSAPAGAAPSGSPSEQLGLSTPAAGSAPQNAPPAATEASSVHAVLRLRHLMQDLLPPAAADTAWPDGAAWPDSIAFWLFLPDGAPVPITTADLPTPPNLAPARERRGETSTAYKAEGTHYILAVGAPREGISLGIAIPATPAMLHARHDLWVRLGELALFLVVCLSLVLLGVEFGVVRPLRQVTRGVAGWAATGMFTVGEKGNLPPEMRALNETFRTATSRLKEREAELEAAVAQRDHVMRELHHRVKNNLQVVASLLNLHANRLRVPEAQAELQAARDRLRALSTLHRHLYAHPDMQRIDLGPFLAELSGLLFESAGEVPGARLRLEVEAPPLHLHSDLAVPLAMLATEAVTNALRYAFPQGRRGRITLALQAEGEHAVLTITDDGVGYPSDHASGMGLRLMEGFARQIGGVLTIEHQDGVRVIFRFPLADPTPAFAA